MHIYQKHILDLLRQNSEQRYSQLQPDGVESSHFKYHLNQLLHDGLVEQAGRGVYRLTAKGMAAVDLLSSGRVRPHTTPKVITYTLLRDDTSYYLTRKDKEPYRGLLNMVGGKVHVGESSDDAARREVFEKTGYQLATLSLQAVAQVRIRTDALLLTHAIAYVYVARLPLERTEADGLTAMPIGKPLSPSQLAPDLLPVLEAIEAGTELQSLDIDSVFAG